MEIGLLILKTLVYAVICFIISVFVHELGHLAMGLVNGWKFYLLVIGPFEWIRKEPNDRVRFCLEKNLSMWGGMGASYPVNREKDNWKIWSRVLMAGPLASIVMGIIMISIAIVTKSIFFMLLAVMPISVGIACGLPIPLRTGFLYSDGGRWIRMRRGGQEEAEERALFLLMENSMVNGEMALPPEKAVSTLLNSAEPRFQYYGLYYRYIISKDSNNQQAMEDALMRMNELKSKVPKLILEDCKIN